jgi:hypothetical protein
MICISKKVFTEGVKTPVTDLQVCNRVEAPDIERRSARPLSPVLIITAWNPMENRI